MTPHTAQLNSSPPYTGSDTVVGNGDFFINILCWYMFCDCFNYSVKCLVVPGITKYVLSLSKLISDSHVDVLFTNNSHECGLYVLDMNQSALVVAHHPKASFELWHSILNVLDDIIHNWKVKIHTSKIQGISCKQPMWDKLCT
ncbi:hypothetical protein ACS0TY_025854 [Phlomoides rotata]